MSNKKKIEEINRVSVKDYFHGKFTFSEFNQDTEVSYVGTQRKDISGKKGWVIGQVKNEPGVYVVEFEGDSYVLPGNSLAKFQGSSEKTGPEIRQIRKRTVED